eukprot:gene2366-18005_t
MFSTDYDWLGNYTARLRNILQSFRDLRGNEITRIDDDDIKGLSNLKELYLDDNKLTAFAAVGKLTSLEHLSVSKNKITTIPNGLLSNLSNLKWLDLSHNEILELPRDAFPPGSSLEYLDLSYNNLTSMINLVEVPMPNLTHLKLGYNKLSSLQCQSCRVEQRRHFQNKHAQAVSQKLAAVRAVAVRVVAVRVVTVRVVTVRVVTVRVVTVRAVTVRVVTVRVVTVRAVTVRVVTVRVVAIRMMAVRVVARRIAALWISFSQSVSNDQCGCFAWSFTTGRVIVSNDQGRTKFLCQEAVILLDQLLAKLDISENRVKGIEPRAFEQALNIEQLNLERNEIRKISKSAFEDLFSLLRLNLSNNQISLGQSDLDTAFKPLLRLRSLDLSGNQIMLIPRNAFRGLHNLVSLNLTSNDVIIVQPRAFSDLTMISEMRLIAPKLICDCSTRWLRNWVRLHSFEKTVIGKCKMPLWLNGKSLLEIDDSEFVCASKVNNSIKPEIIVHPKTQEIRRHSNVTLQCVATVLFPDTPQFGLTLDDRKARTSMNMEWYYYGSDDTERFIEDKLVKTSPQKHIGMRVYRRMSELTLRNVDYTDVGRYRCHVRNFYGDEWSQKANLTVVVFPYFVKKPKDTRVRSGVSVQISCSAKGSPVPSIKVSWKKGGTFPAVDEKRFWISTSEDGYKFGISNVKIHDSGEYICSASSRVGTINSSMILTVIAQPQFVRPMKSKKVIVGSTAVFECIFTGNPKLKVEWFKNNTKIEKGKNGRFTVSDQLLIILGVQFNDAGTYACRVSNTLGMKFQTAKLAVVSDVSAITNAPVNSKAMPVKLFIGIIVITVISVTILTSLVWVVLICLCKGRRNRYPRAKQRQNVSAENTEHQEPAGDIQENSNPFTVPPLLVNDGSGLVFGYGHLYPDNQRNITEREILAHIRGEGSLSESIPLMAAKKSQLSDSEAATSGSYNDQRVDDVVSEPAQRSHDTSHDTSQRFGSQAFYDRIKGVEPNSSSTDALKDSKTTASPRKDMIYCSCPADISDGLLIKSVSETPQKRTSSSGRTSHKKRVPRRPSHALQRRDIDNEEYYNNYNNASSSGVESGESSSSSDSVSVTNFDVTRAKSSSILAAV